MTEHNHYFKLNQAQAEEVRHLHDKGNREWHYA